jgi:hypothetical protein
MVSLKSTPGARGPRALSGSHRARAGRDEQTVFGRLGLGRRGGGRRVGHGDLGQLRRARQQRIGGRRFRG